MSVNEGNNNKKLLLVIIASVIFSACSAATGKLTDQPNASGTKPQSDISEWKFANVTTIKVQETELKFADGKTQKLKIGDFIALN